MSIRAQFFNFILKRTVKNQLAGIDDDVVAFREKLAGSGNLGPGQPDDVVVETVSANGVDCEWVSRGNATPNKVLLYFHGGGYVFGNPEGHRNLIWRLSEESGLKVLAVDYRLAPEHKFPAAVEDATACYRWLLEEGIEPQDIVIGGDSAGGGLAVALMVNLKNLGVKLPAGALLISPWVDLSASGDSVASNAKADSMLSPVALDKFAAHYLGDLDRKAPLASPLFADLVGLPPMFVIVGSTEVLLSDAERLVEKLHSASVEAVLEVFPKMPHVFPLFAGRIPEADAAITKLAEFARMRAS